MLSKRSLRKDVPVKKLLFLFCAFALLLSGTAFAQGDLLLDETEVQIRLVSQTIEDGQVTLRLRCENTGDSDQSYLVFAPSLNGEPASFRYSWPAERIFAPRNSESETEITLYPDDPSLLPQTAAFRLIDSADISGEIRLDLQSEEPLVRCASFDWTAQEAALVDDRCQISIGAEACTLHDTLPPEKVRLLDHAQLQICLRSISEGEEQLLPFATVHAQVSPDGAVTARYSGSAVVCSALPHLPLKTLEEHSSDGVLYRISDISLSGLYVFYAPLQLSFQADPSRSCADLVQLELDFLETGPLRGNVPLSLFDALHLAHPVYIPVSSEGAMRMTEAGIVSETIALKDPLLFSIVPAGSLGEIVAYFEYFFNDQTDLIHPFFSLEN